MDTNKPASKSKGSPPLSDKTGASQNNKKGQKKKKKQKKNVTKDGNVLREPEREGGSVIEGRNETKAFDVLTVSDTTSEIPIRQSPAEGDPCSPPEHAADGGRGQGQPPVKVAFPNSSRPSKKLNPNAGRNVIGNGATRKFNNQNKATMPTTATTTATKAAPRWPLEVFNESLRWEYRLDDPLEEEKRIRIYKFNRRKRYLAAQNATASRPEVRSSGGSQSSRSSLSLTPPTDANATGSDDKDLSLPELMSSRIVSPSSARLDDIHLDTVACH